MMRLDQYIAERFELASREKARALIMQGCCYINGQRADKPGHSVKQSDNVELIIPNKTYVSRGGYKLQQAIEKFSLNLNNLCMMDIGASTGGFTDCALQNGASFVYAVDVGYGQLDYRLRNDEKVCCLERTNIRYLCEDLIDKKVDLFTIDVSFISLKLIFPLLEKYAGESYNVVALIKPQFEAGRSEVGKNGVIKDEKIHKKVINSVLGYAKEAGLNPFGLYFSPIKGPKGNIEFLVALSSKETAFIPDIDTVVKQAHENL